MFITPLIQLLRAKSCWSLGAVWLLQGTLFQSRMELDGHSFDEENYYLDYSVVSEIKCLVCVGFGGL